jgi:hypothetical protein
VTTRQEGEDAARACASSRPGAITIASNPHARSACTTVPKRASRGCRYAQMRGPGRGRPLDFDAVGGGIDRARVLHLPGAVRIQRGKGGEDLNVGPQGFVHRDRMSRRGGDRAQDPPVELPQHRVVGVRRWA